jgi:hypothetical protein
MPCPLDDLLSSLGRLLVEYLPPRRPLPVRATPTRQDADVLIYALSLPPAGAPDVVLRELTVTVNGAAREPIAVADGHELGFAQGDAVGLVLVDVDDAGNRSQPSPALEFVATDTLPPPPPGDLGVALLREE